mmetsp:Transcript_4036/g.9620  ORF Transcript_4036/g.9620 Transcript_4036/m.9620 type:complete len:108 (+) Transcript_4036:446-769(+)
MFVLGRVFCLRRQGIGTRGRGCKTPSRSSSNSLERLEAAKGMSSNCTGSSRVFACEEKIGAGSWNGSTHQDGVNPVSCKRESHGRPAVEERTIKIIRHNAVVCVLSE